MTRTYPRRLAPLAAAVAAVLAVSLQAQQPAPPGPPAPQAPGGGSFRFKSGVDLVNVTATVIDAGGRFVPGLRQEDFRIYEDDQPQAITHFSNERTPVSLGLVLDTSGSMAGEKIEAAERALARFVYDLMGPDDEFFIDRFSTAAQRLQEWTGDRSRLGSAIRRLSAGGGTAMYDAVADAVPYASAGRHQKKAIVLISDGNDTGSATSVRELKQMVRESEVLVYAIGIDGESETTFVAPRQPRLPIPIPFPGRPRFPFPIPGGGRGGPGGGGGGITMRHDSDRVNAGALHDITDDSGGRTEIIRTGRDLEPATAHIADELSKQYYLAYQGGGKRDGKWHAIRVEVADPRLRVRARRGYIAS